MSPRSGGDLPDVILRVSGWPAGCRLQGPGMTSQMSSPRSEVDLPDDILDDLLDKQNMYKSNPRKNRYIQKQITRFPTRTSLIDNIQPNIKVWNLMRVDWGWHKCHPDVCESWRWHRHISRWHWGWHLITSGWHWGWHLLTSGWHQGWHLLTSGWHQWWHLHTFRWHWGWHLHTSRRHQGWHLHASRSHWGDLCSLPDDIWMTSVHFWMTLGMTSAPLPDDIWDDICSLLDDIGDNICSLLDDIRDDICTLLDNISDDICPFRWHWVMTSAHFQKTSGMTSGHFWMMLEQHLLTSGWHQG